MSNIRNGHVVSTLGVRGPKHMYLDIERYPHCGFVTAHSSHEVVMGTGLTRCMTCFSLFSFLLMWLVFYSYFFLSKWLSVQSGGGTPQAFTWWSKRLRGSIATFVRTSSCGATWCVMFDLASKTKIVCK